MDSAVQEIADRIGQTLQRFEGNVSSKWDQRARAMERVESMVKENAGVGLGTLLAKRLDVGLRVAQDALLKTGETLDATKITFESLVSGAEKIIRDKQGKEEERKDKIKAAGKTLLDGFGLGAFSDLFDTVKTLVSGDNALFRRSQDDLKKSLDDDFDKLYEVEAKQLEKLDDVEGWASQYVKAIDKVIDKMDSLGEVLSPDEKVLSAFDEIADRFGVASEDVADDAMAIFQKIPSAIARIVDRKMLANNRETRDEEDQSGDFDERVATLQADISSIRSRRMEGMTELVDSDEEQTDRLVAETKSVAGGIEQVEKELGSSFGRVRKLLEGLNDEVADFRHDEEVRERRNRKLDTMYDMPGIAAVMGDDMKKAGGSLMSSIMSIAKFAAPALGAAFSMIISKVATFGRGIGGLFSGITKFGNVFSKMGGLAQVLGKAGPILGGIVTSIGAVMDVFQLFKDPKSFIEELDLDRRFGILGDAIWGMANPLQAIVGIFKNVGELITSGFEALRDLLPSWLGGRKTVKNMEEDASEYVGNASKEGLYNEDTMTGGKWGVVNLRRRGFSEDQINDVFKQMQGDVGKEEYQGEGGKFDVFKWIAKNTTAKEDALKSESKAIEDASAQTKSAIEDQGKQWTSQITGMGDTLTSTVGDAVEGGTSDWMEALKTSMGEMGKTYGQSEKGNIGKELLDFLGVDTANIDGEAFKSAFSKMVPSSDNIGASDSAKVTSQGGNDLPKIETMKTFFAGERKTANKPAAIPVTKKTSSPGSVMGSPLIPDVDDVGLNMLNGGFFMP